MRTLFEIVEGAKDSNKPTHDECYYAMLALDSLRHFDHHALMDIYQAGDELKPSLMMRVKGAFPESFRRSKAAFDRDPQQWLGNNVPENPEQQRMRKMAFKVFERATGVDLRGESG